MDTQELASIILSQTAADNPLKYANIIKASRTEEVAQLRELLPTMREQLEKYERITKQAKEFRKQVSGEGYAKRRKEAKKMFEGLDKQTENIAAGPIDISTIIASHYENITNLYSALVQGSELLASTKMVSLDETMSRLSNQLNSSSSELGEERVKAIYSTLTSGVDDVLKSLSMEQQLNRGATNSFLQGLSILEKVPKMYEQYLQSQSRNFEHYYEKLRHRHSNGMVICNHGEIPSPTLTDVSLLIWENLDKVGEIEAGHSKDELSAYTIHRAYALVEAAKFEEIWSWITVPGEQMIRWATIALPTIESVVRLLIKLKQTLGEPVWKLLALDMKKVFRDFESVIESLEISQITQRPPERAFSKTEKFALEHQNKSIQTVADLITTGQDIGVISDEILKLKVEERNFFVLENSFYVCRIGTGNMFTGEAPGAIEILPGEKPDVKLDNIWGSGFDEVKKFIEGMDEAKKWSPLFLATSPSKSTDKANVLLVGPQGCGKCVVGNTMIFTDKGLKTILQLQPGKVDSDGYHPLNVGVKSINGMTRSSHFYDSGVQPCIKITDHFGFEIEGTGKHRVIVSTDSGPDWKRLDQIQEGDYVAIVSEGLPTGSLETDSKEAYSLGYETKEDGLVPNLILESNKAAWRAYLSGLFDFSGGSFGNVINFRARNETLVRQVQLMLTAFGVVSRVSVSEDYWTLFIYDEDAGSFYSNIGFGLEKKQMEFRNISEVKSDLSSTQYRWSKIVSVEHTGDKPVYDLVVPGAESFAANGMMNHNTEILRALASDKDSIAIFAVGSDFLTCWLGEAQKNPKRLFDEAIKLHKSSGRPVHILIDEIDMVLNDDQSTSKINLSLEFQNLMDGVVAYPGISIWGATNHPKRIPTPMLRRFAKVMVVGELSQEDAVSVLRYYIETFLPTSSISEDDYLGWAKKLEGATGDVLRKAIDEVWLNLMRGFIASHKEQAERILEFIYGTYGFNFEVSDLKNEDRETIKSMIAETGTTVTPDIITEYVEKILNNFAVQQQIKVAKDTYKNAKILLARQKAGDSGVGF